MVEGADEIIVSLGDRREFKAEIVGLDARSDVALLKIEAENLPILNELMPFNKFVQNNHFRF